MKRVLLVLLVLAMATLACSINWGNAPATVAPVAPVVEPSPVPVPPTAVPTLVPPTPTPVPEPRTTLELVQSMGFVESEMTCQAGHCRKFDNDDLGMRVLIFDDQTIGIYPHMQADHDLDAQLDFVADVFRLQGLGEGAVKWMYDNAPGLPVKKAVANIDNNNGVMHFTIMILVPNPDGEMILNINIKPPGVMGLNESSAIHVNNS